MPDTPFILDLRIVLATVGLTKRCLKDFKHDCYNIKITMDELKDRLNQSRPFNQNNFLTLRIIKKTFQALIISASNVTLSVKIFKPNIGK